MQPNTENLHAFAKSPGHEMRDASPKAINLIFAFVVALSIIGPAVCWGFVKLMDKQRAANAPVLSPLAGTLPEQPPEPRLQVAPAKDLREVRGAEEAVLNHYALIDEKGEIARIPIDRAMQLVAERGLPVRDEVGSKKVKK